MPASNDSIERVRIDYADKTLRLSTIAARHGLTVAQITALGRKHDWPARGRARSKSVVRKRPSKSASLAERRRIVRRLYAAIITKLAQLEDRMSSPETPTPADAERETRALASLIRSVERVHELETDLTRGAKLAGNPAGPDAAGPNADAERKRRELAERIRRLGEQIARGNTGGAGGPPAG
jgi:hypothetical protein